jgi:altronate dehydratase large subunit
MAADLERSAQACDVSSLILCVKCGGSDYTSGLAANPALGRVADRLVDAGGSAVLGEIAEIMGAEHLLAARAASPNPPRSCLRVVSRVEAEAIALGSTSAARSRRPATSAAGSRRSKRSRSARRTRGASTPAHRRRRVLRADHRSAA